MIEYRYNDDEPMDRSIEVYRDGKLITGIFYLLNSHSSMAELVELLNKLTSACNKEIL